MNGQSVSIYIDWTLTVAMATENDRQYKLNDW